MAQVTFKGDNSGESWKTKGNPVFHFPTNDHSAHSSVKAA